jgi:hypothetical protein
MANEHNPLISGYGGFPVDRPRTAHRRRHADSITVVDLIRRHYAQSCDGWAPTGAERITEKRMAGLLGPVEVRQSLSRTTTNKTGRTAKVVGLTVGAMALCGSVVTAASFAHHRPTSNIIEPAALPTEVTGVDALRPDSLAGVLGDTSTHHRPAPTAPATASAPPTGQARLYRYDGVGGSPGTPSTEAPTTAGVTSTPQQQSTQHSAQDVVRSFFQLVTTSPTTALSLLDPSLLASGRGDFVQSWSEINQVTVESVYTTPAGEVQAVIRLLLPDGTWMRVVERLDMTAGNPPLINGADLLSAQRD